MSDEFIATWRKTLAERPDSTHYDGCHLSHPLCALSFAIVEIVRLRAVLDAIDPLHQPYNGQRGTRWCEAGDCDDSGWPCPTHLLIHPVASSSQSNLHGRPMTMDEAINILGTIHK